MKSLNISKIILALIFILLSSFSCYSDLDLDEKPVVVINQTEELILVQAADRELDKLNVSTILNHNPFDPIFILPGEAGVVSYYYFSGGASLPQDSLILYIIKKGTLDKYPINEIIVRNIYDDKLRFSYDNVFATDFKIIYK